MQGWKDSPLLARGGLVAARKQQQQSMPRPCHQSAAASPVCVCARARARVRGKATGGHRRPGRRRGGWEKGSPPLVTQEVLSDFSRNVLFNFSPNVLFFSPNVMLHIGPSSYQHRQFPRLGTAVRAGKDDFRWRLVLFSVADAYRRTLQPSTRQK